METKIFATCILCYAAVPCIAMHFAMHRRGFCFDFTADLRVLPHGKNAGRSNLAFDFAVDRQVVLKLDRTFDFDVRGEDIFAVGGVFGHD